MAESTRVADLRMSARVLRDLIRNPGEHDGPYIHNRIRTLAEINRELDALGSNEGAPVDEVAAARQARRGSIAHDQPPAIGG